MATDTGGIAEVVRDGATGVLVRVGDSDEATNATMARIQADGTCWLSGTTFRGRTLIRISVVGWSTTEQDIDRAAEAIVAAAR